MSRFSAVSHEAAGQVVCLPDKEFRLSLTQSSTRFERIARPCVVRSLHVAMQTGPSHDPLSWTSGVWSLRILISSCLGLRRFIV
jgi:hypothetical protein